MNNIFIKVKNIDLKVLTQVDVVESNWFNWFNDESTTKFMQQHYFPNSVEKQKVFWESLQQNTNKIQLGILPHGASQIVGCVSLSQIDWINRKGEFSIIIGEQTFLSKGIAAEATYLILRHGFQSLNLHKVFLGVHAGHEKAIKSYQKSGFTVEGVLREDIYKEGKFYDTVIMSILNTEFQEHIYDSQ